MIWKDVIGFEEYFSVSYCGQVRSKRTNRVLKQHVNRYGYHTIATRIGGRKGKSYCFKVHRLVAEAFLPNPASYAQVNHINGVKGCNAVSNLEWCDAAHNIRHAFATGLNVVPSGFDSKQSSLTREQVEWAKAQIVPNSRQHGVSELARQLGVSRDSLRRSLTW